MKPLKNKITKNLIMIAVIMIIFSSLLPNPVQAKTDTGDGGKLLEMIEEIVVYICDNAMQWLQDAFVSTDSIQQEDGTYLFQYSPAIIFSGTVPAFDIDFINYDASNDNVNNNEQNQTYKQYIEENIDKYIEEANDTTAEDYNEKKDKANDKKIGEVTEKVEYASSSDSEYPKGTLKYEIYYYIEKDETTNSEDLVVEVFETRLGYGVVEIGYGYGIVKESVDNSFGVYASTAGILQNTIATWYNVLRRIALVGLLSVLVYVGIRIVLTSSSQDKAKYKNMLKDWLVAICLLFTLHYIMSITITVVNKISDIFAVGQYDELISTLRNKIHDGGSWGEVVAQLIMYAFLVAQTFMFTVQYIKRVIYMAFYSLIAPLITLTYPLDKIKDGQAQAFNTWIKEYLFTALIQVMHLVIYFVLVGSALELVSDYEIYAIIVISFISKAEDLLKKMFGFNNAETIGTLGDAATGGLMMNLLQKIKPSGKKKEEAEENGTSNGNSNKPVRTATNTNPLNALKTPPTSGAGSSGSTHTSTTTHKNGLGLVASRGVIGALNSAGKLGKAGGWSKSLAGTPIMKGLKSFTETPIIKGATSLAGKYTGTLGKGALKLVTRGAGFIIGTGAAFGKGNIMSAVATGIAGSEIGGNIVEWGSEKVTGILDFGSHAVENVVNPINKIVNGSSEATRNKFDRTFYKSSEYRNLRNKHGDKLSQDDVQAMLNAKITDAKEMDKVVSNIGKEDISNVDEAIAYYTLAQRCPDSIFYGEDSDFEEYLENLGLNRAEAAKIRKNMRLFRKK